MMAGEANPSQLESCSMVELRLYCRLVMWRIDDQIEKKVPGGIISGANW